MATLYVTEYEDLGQTSYGTALREPRLANQTLSISSSVVSSAAFNKATRLIRLHTDSTCCIEIGNQTFSATVGTSQRVSANTVEIRAVAAGTGLQISVIGSS